MSQFTSVDYPETATSLLFNQINGYMELIINVCQSVNMIQLHIMLLLIYQIKILILNRELCINTTILNFMIWLAISNIIIFVFMISQYSKYV